MKYNCKTVLPSYLSVWWISVSLLCPCIDKSRTYRFCPVCLSVQKFRLTITLEWYMIQVSYFLCVFLENFSLIPRPRSPAKAKVKYQSHNFQKMAVVGEFMFHKHILFIFVLTVSKYGYRTQEMLRFCPGYISCHRVYLAILWPVYVAGFQFDAVLTNVWS